MPNKSAKPDLLAAVGGESETYSQGRIRVEPGWVLSGTARQRVIHTMKKKRGFLKIYFFLQYAVNNLADRWNFRLVSDRVSNFGAALDLPF